MEIELPDTNAIHLKTEDINIEKNNINNILNSKNLNPSKTEILLYNNKASKYDHAKKMELVKKINKIKKKEYLIDIFKVITTDTQDYSENNNGVFIFFHNLSDDTYEKVETVVNNIYKMHRLNNSTTTTTFNSDMSDTYNNLSETIQISTVDKNLSNKEKMIMRRKKYEEYLNHNQD